MNVVRVAVPVPMLKQFDYTLESGANVAVGSRVRVPFGRRELIGVVVETNVELIENLPQLKPVIAVLDNHSVFNPSVWNLLKFAAQYYHHPLGEVLHHALPVALRQGEAATFQSVLLYRLSTEGAAQDSTNLKRAPQQLRLLEALRRNELTRSELRTQDYSMSALKVLLDKGWIESVERQPDATTWQFAQSDNAHRLNDEQAVAVAAIQQVARKAGEQSTVWLLEGVTGSGKTEVYLQAMAPVLEAGRQVLVLVPEIGLTPQTVARFSSRFSVPVVALHSGLNDSERLLGWLQARDNQAAIIIGTRSAIFTPLKRPGLIILDEEHDSSFKQQDGFRYNARDLAVKRAHDEKVGLILGSATPSLESLSNVEQKRYHHLVLSKRAGAAQLARHVLIDLKQERLRHGLSDSLSDAIRKHVSAGNQVLLFLNRRGFASAVLCHECGWVGECARCERPFTLHQHSNRLQCHHCGAERAVPRQCHACGSSQLITQGLGTEQLEQALSEMLPEYPVLRIDRDSTRRKGELGQALEAAAQGDYPILIGTQMLAKGHHFPNVTLVALLDVDGALYSSDFRASERLGQLYTQVAGRAGRASKPGVVVLQTHHPEHPLIQELVNNGYQQFARTALIERQQAMLPPAASMALLRAEATKAEDAEQALMAMAELLKSQRAVSVLGPMSAPMPRKAGRYRYQLLLHAGSRSELQLMLRQYREQLESLPVTRKARWSLDIDPQDFT